MYIYRMEHLKYYKIVILKLLKIVIYDLFILIFIKFKNKYNHNQNFILKINILQDIKVINIFLNGNMYFYYCDIVTDIEANSMIYNNMIFK